MISSNYNFAINKAKESYQNNNFDEAEKLFLEILEYKPNCLDSLFFLGVIKLKNNENDLALIFLNRYLEFNEENHLVHLNIGIIHTKLNNSDLAIASYLRSLSYKVSPAALQNLSSLLWKKGDKKQSVKYYNKLTKIYPSREKFANLSLMYQSNQNYRESIEIGSKVILEKINDQFEELAISTFCKSLLNLKQNDIAEINDVIHKVIDCLLSQGNEIYDLPANFIQSIFVNYDTKNPNKLEFNEKSISKLVIDDPLIFSDESFFHLISNDLIKNFLRVNLVTNIHLENIFTKLREFMLESYILERNDFIKKNIDLIISINIQCEFNGYIWNVSKKEENYLASIKKQILNLINDGKYIPEELICIYGSYYPIYNFNELKAYLLKNENKFNFDISEIIHSHILLPIEIIKNSDLNDNKIDITDQTSQIVKKLYESYPYPRWKGKIKNYQNSLSNYGNTSSYVLNKISPTEKKDILVAGCGTGKELIQIAGTYKHSKIIAIDLSSSSLGYTKIKIDEHNFKNIELKNLDILDLDKLNKKFDIIICRGVLHHMYDPSKGLKALNGCLKDDGIMNIALYSELARNDLSKIRNKIKLLKYENNLKDVRKFRSEIKSDKDTKFIWSIRDFYSYYEFQDLIFHPREVLFNISQIQNLLKSNNLKFLEFDAINNKVFEMYKSKFIDDDNFNSLDNWRILEEENNQIFMGMYQFFLEKNDL